MLLAMLRAGLVAVPVNLRLKSAEIGYIFEHSGARIGFSEPGFAALAEGASRDRPVEIVTEMPAPTLAVPLPEVDPSQPATILYTSGTTARPKGVIHSHSTLLEHARLYAAEGLLEPDDVIFPTTSLMHAGALIYVLTALYQGGTAVLLRTFDPSAALDLIERFRCTWVHDTSVAR